MYCMLNRIRAYNFKWGLLVLYNKNKFCLEVYKNVQFFFFNCLFILANSYVFFFIIIENIRDILNQLSFGMTAIT